MEDIAPSLPGSMQRRGDFPSAVMETTRSCWKSGSLVRLLSGGEAMNVMGYDSVGSVICRPLNDERHLGFYVPPSLLVAADPDPDDGTPRPATDIIAENA
jgi:uncharacterized protein YodC (DUF2158 family)